VVVFCMGLLGEYIGRVYDEVRRPLYVIHQVHKIAPEMKKRVANVVAMKQ
jgi:hypothetical protein